MKSLAAGLFLLLAAAASGCSSHCSDGSSGMGMSIGPVGMSSSRYRACAEECCDPIEPKPCGCSRNCPCWRKHP